MNNLSPNNSKFEFCSTKNILYVPLRPSPEINSDMIALCIKTHIKFIKNSSIIVLHDISDPNEIIHDTINNSDVPLQQCIQQHIPIIRAIEYSSTNNKLIIFTKNHDRSEIITRLDKLNQQISNSNPQFNGFKTPKIAFQLNDSVSVNTRCSYAEILMNKNEIKKIR